MDLERNLDLDRRPSAEEAQAIQKLGDCLFFKGWIVEKSKIEEGDVQFLPPPRSGAFFKQMKNEFADHRARRVWFTVFGILFVAGLLLFAEQLKGGVVVLAVGLIFLVALGRVTFHGMLIQKYGTFHVLRVSKVEPYVTLGGEADACIARGYVEKDGGSHDVEAIVNGELCTYLLEKYESLEILVMFYEKNPKSMATIALGYRGVLRSLRSRAVL